MIQCPRCQSGIIHIDAHITAEVSASDGWDIYPIQAGDERPSWSPDDAARCRECHFEGTVATFVDAQSEWYTH